MSFDPASAVAEDGDKFDPSTASFDPSSAAPEPRRGGTRADVPAPVASGAERIKRSKEYMAIVQANQPAPSPPSKPSTLQSIGEFASRVGGQAVDAVTDWANKDRAASALGQVGAVGAIGDHRTPPGKETAAHVEAFGSVRPVDTFLGGIETVKSIAKGAQMFPATARSAGALASLADFDAIDQGQPPTSSAPMELGADRVMRRGQPNALVQDYRLMKPDERQQIRQQLLAGLAEDKEFIAQSIQQLRGYQEASLKATGRMPDFTDIRSTRDFGVWLARQGINNAPTMAAAMVGAMAGVPGLLATSGATAIGDLTQGHANFAGEVYDPKRFGTADRIVDATQQQADLQQRHMAGSVPSTAALTPLYMAGDMVGPEATMARSVGKETGAKTFKEIAKDAVKKLPAETGGEFIGEGPIQESANIMAEQATGENAQTTQEKALRVINAGMAGAAGAATTGHPINVASDVVRATVNSPERQIAREIDRAAADYEKQTKALRPTERRKAANDRLDDFAAEHGITSNAVTAAKKEAEGMPLAEVPGFYKRFMASITRRLGRQADDVMLGALDEPKAPAADETPTAPSAAQNAPTTLADRLGDRFGLNDAPIGAAVPHETAAPQPDTGPVPASEVLGTPLDEQAPAPAPATSAEHAGEPINRNWTAFAPESGSLNIPREQLPQISAEHRGALVNFLAARGITHESAEVPADSLKPTQGEFSPRKVQQAREYQGGDRSILVSSDGYVLDGHHQWLARLDNGEPVKVIRLDAPIQDLLRLAHQFPSSTTAPGPRRTAAEQQAAGAPEASPAVKGVPSAGSGAAPVAPAPTVGPRVIARAGRTPSAAQPIELRPNADGTLTPFMEGKAMLDYESGNPITMPAGVSDLDAKKAIRAAGAVSNKVNFFAPTGAEKTTAQPEQVAAPPAAEAPAQSPAPEVKKPDRAARAKARMALDPTKDSMLEALAKLGGIRRDVVASEFGLKPEELKHTVKVGGLNGFPFRKSGGMDLDRALTALREAGYFTGVSDEDVRAAFEQAIYNELGGGRELTAAGQMADAQRQTEERALEEEAAARAEYDAEAKAEREAIMAEAGVTDEGMATLTDDDIDLDAKGNASTEAFMRAMGASEQEIADAIAEEEAGRRAAQGNRQEAGQTADGEARPADGAGSGQARPGAAEGEGLTLEAPTRAQVLAQQDAIEKEQADREAPADQPRDQRTADQVDLFNTQGSIFDKQADLAPAETPAAAETKPQPRPEELIALRKRASVLKSLMECLSA